MPVENIDFVKGHQKTESVENAVKVHSTSDPRLQDRPHNEALVRSCPIGAWHQTETDPKEHLTVDFRKDGQHVTTHHVYRPAEGTQKK